MSESGLRQARVLAPVTAVVFLLTACGGQPPTHPSPPVTPPLTLEPPTNALPVIDAIAVQGTRRNEPPNFADAGEDVPVTATVHDDETPPDQLTYQWSATAGTFEGTGASVTWKAPAVVESPVEATITLKVVEKYGPGSAPQAFQHDVSRTASLSLHDSIKEVGEMARQFMLEFSDSSNRDVPSIMRNFSVTRCPEPHEVDSETSDVANNREHFRIVNSRIGPAAVTVGFGGRCPLWGKMGDACAVVPAFWESIDLRDNSRGAVDGRDIIAAAYAPADSRWWLCASNYDGHKAFGATLRGFIR